VPRYGQQLSAEHCPLALLSTTGHDHLPEIWCRCNDGPHGFLKIATHPYAPTLSVEVCYGGVDILADPGTYCYHGDALRQSYFHSTIPRSRRAHAQETEVNDQGDVVDWVAEHDGFLGVDSPVRHRRSVLLDRASRIVDIVDQIDGGNRDICPAFHFGPEIQVELSEFYAFLSWPSSTVPGAARLELPLGLSWSLQCTEIDAIPGGIGGLTLVGRGRCVAGAPLATRLEFNDTEMVPKAPFLQAVPWSAYGSCQSNEHETRAEAR
jgi:Heparinase II/III-like protein